MHLISYLTYLFYLFIHPFISPYPSLSLSLSTYNPFRVPFWTSFMACTPLLGKILWKIRGSLKNTKVIKRAIVFLCVRVCLCTYMYLYLSIRLHIHHVYMYMCTYMYLYSPTCLHIHHVYMYIMCVCAYVCVSE